MSNSLRWQPSPRHLTALAILLAVGGALIWLELVVITRSWWVASVGAIAVVLLLARRRKRLHVVRVGSGALSERSNGGGRRELLRTAEVAEGRGGRLQKRTRPKRRQTG